MRNGFSSSSRTRLLVGLGNPGAEYRDTRHNLGFRVVDAMAEQLSIPVERNKFNSLFGRGPHAGEKIILAKPQAFMNNSGPPVARLSAFFGIENDDIVVIHDDLDLALGSVTIKMKGGSGGHNGLKSLVDALGGGNFTRVRIGIGRPEAGKSVTHHVLGRFSIEERDVIDAILAGALDAALMILRKDTKAAMNHFNAKDILISD
jgi:peptidyl-tRNA hydrolase, PTH1 family